MPKIRNVGSPSMLLTSQPKFWPKNPVTNVSGRKTVASTVSCSMVVFCRHADVGLLHRDHGHVGFEDGAQQVALGGDLLVDQDEVVTDVSEVGAEVGVGF